MKIDKFLEEIYEIAFGDDAINKGYTSEDVVQRLKEFAEDSYTYGKLWHD